MTPEQRKAMEMALEALDIVKIHFTQNRHVKEAITALRQALEQQPAGEPVAWMYTSHLAGNERFITRFQHDLSTYKADKVWPLYTRPQPAAWVGLTDEDKEELDEKYGDDYLAHLDAVEAKLKEKNT